MLSGVGQSVWLHFVVPPVPDTPVEVLVDLLTKAKEIAAASGHVPKELTGHLQKALEIASGLDDYLEIMTTQESEPLAELYKYVLASYTWSSIAQNIYCARSICSHCHSYLIVEKRSPMTGIKYTKRAKPCSGFPRSASLDILKVWTFTCVLLVAIIFTGLPHCENLLSGLILAGQTLKMLIHMSQAKRVLEIGMFTGYGALSMAEGLPEDGCLIACELEPYLKDFAQPIFDKSPHGKKITVKTGSAMDTLKVREKREIWPSFKDHVKWTILQTNNTFM